MTSDSFQADPTMSRSPSPSRSIGKTEEPLVLFSMICLTKNSDPLFLYHTIPAVSIPAAIRSISPSSSKSTGCTSQAPFKFPSIIFSVKDSEPLFSNQEISSSHVAAPTISRSPSPSKSAGYIAFAPLKLPSITILLKF